MKSVFFSCGLFACAFSLAACKEKDAPKESADAASAPSVAALPPAVAAPPPAPEQPLPTEVDFEEEASQQITNKNLEQELDKLERELKSP